MENNYNECPCCHQDWVADTDRNCPTCELPISEHVSVEVLCRRVREAQNRESALIVERDKERALADRLAGGLLDTSDVAYGYAPKNTLATLAAWKEARNEIQVTLIQ